MLCVLVAVGMPAVSSAAVFTPVPTSAALDVRRPSALAYDASGRLFIADAAANRIFVAAPNRPSVLFAGSASGEAGYADGPAGRARFNDPSGLAVGPHGDLYVADAGNNVIRRITPAGVVSTYAGTAHAGRVDGPRTKAEFASPVGVATDEAGDVFVADGGAGIREITARGDVATLPIPVHDPKAVAVGESVSLFASDADGIVVYRLSDHGIRRIPSTPRTGAGGEELQGLRPLGVPLALAAMDSSSVLYLTAEDTLHYLDVDQGFTRVVAAGPSLAGAVAVANAPNGRAAVADASGAIAVVSGLDLRKPIMPGDTGVLPNHFKLDPSAYNIAYIGASFVWWDTDWDDSMQGVLEDALLREPNGRRLKPHVIPVVMPGGTLQACEQYGEFLGDLGTVRLVILDVSRTLITQSFPVSPQTIALDRRAWEPQVLTDLTKLRDTLAADRAQLLVVVHPEKPDMLGQAEGVSFLASDLQQRGVHAINLYPDFGRASATAELFDTADPHFSAAGRKVEAIAVAQALDGAPPWSDVQARATESPRPVTNVAVRSRPTPRGTPRAAAPAVRQGPAQPRFVDAWTDLNSAVWMLTHTTGVRVADGTYQLAMTELYAAIGALDDGITSSTRKPQEPANPPSDGARVRAALDLLNVAAADLAPHSKNRTAEPLRIRALGATRKAQTAVATLVDACGC